MCQCDADAGLPAAGLDAPGIFEKLETCSPLGNKEFKSPLAVHLGMCD